MPPLSAGELLRAKVQAGTDVGRAAQDAMQQGDLLADDLVIALTRS